MSVTHPVEALVTEYRKSQTVLWEDTMSKRVYQTLVMSNLNTDQEDLPATIVYQDILTKEIVARPLERFLERFTPYYVMPLATDIH